MRASMSAVTASSTCRLWARGMTWRKGVAANGFPMRVITGFAAMDMTADDVGGECHRGGDGNFPCGLAEPVDVVQDAGGMAGGIEMGCDGQPQAEQPHVACGQGRPKVTQSGEQLGEHAYDRSWPDLSL